MEGGESEGEQVMSDVHLGCPPGFAGPYVSRFTFVPPEYKLRTGGNLLEELDLINRKVSLDEDGDLILPRRNGKEPSDQRNTIIIQHYITSTIPSVGLQVWRAELVLSDFLLHKMFTSSELHGIVALDLGAGTGLAGLLLVHTARIVFLTDKGDEILENCVKNIALNSGVSGSRGVIHVRELDWTQSWPPRGYGGASPPPNKYSWMLSEVKVAQNASLLIAADVIYNYNLTDAFFSVLESIMSQGAEKVLYLALEKRYNFTLDDFDVVANGYWHFRSYLREDENHDFSKYGVSRRFSGKCIDITKIPQYFRDYNRENNVELWEIKYDTKIPL